MSSDEENAVRAQSDEEEMVNQELENLKNDSPEPPPQVSKQTLLDTLRIFHQIN